jgi:hypothetical protein
MVEPTREQMLLKTVAILAATFVVYIPLAWAGFLWDDDVLLYDAPLVHASDGIYRFWFTTEAYEYFPIANSSLWIEWRLWGMNAFYYHVASVALHATTALVVWRILARLAIPGAWLIALVFAVHPVNVASVMWIAQRKNILALLFAALCAYSFLRSEEENPSRWYVLSLLSFLLALLSKTAVAALPVVLLGFVWWRRGSIRMLDLKRTLPFFAVSGALSLATIYFQNTNGITPEMTELVRPEGFASRIAAAGWAVWFYIFKALWPTQLAMIYPRWDVDPTQFLHWAPLLLLVGVFATAWQFYRQGGRAVLFGFGSMILLALPTLGFFRMYYNRYSLVADHWHYPAIIATIALALGGATHLWRRWGQKGWLVGIVVATLMVVMLGTLTFRRTIVFSSKGSLFAHDAEAFPLSSGAQYNYGLTLAEKGDLAAAKSAYRQAIALNPKYTEAYYNIGELERVAGDLSSALYYYEQAVDLSTVAAFAHYGQGQVLEALERPHEARIQYREALEADASHEGARAALDRLSNASGDDHQGPAQQDRS